MVPDNMSLAATSRCSGWRTKNNNGKITNMRRQQNYTVQSKPITAPPKICRTNPQLATSITCSLASETSAMRWHVQTVVTKVICPFNLIFTDTITLNISRTPTLITTNT